MLRDVRLDCSLLNHETFPSKVGALEPPEQLIFCEYVILQCQTLQGQTAELLVAALGWIEEKNLPQHIGQSATAYIRTLGKRYPVVATVATMRRERQIEQVKEDIEKIWKAPLEKILGPLHPPTLSIQFVESLRKIAKLCPNAVEARNEIESQISDRVSQLRNCNHYYAIREDVREAAKALRVRQCVEGLACSSTPEKRTYGLRWGAQPKSKRLRGEGSAMGSHTKESRTHSPPNSPSPNQTLPGGEGQSRNGDAKRAILESPPTSLAPKTPPGPDQCEHPGGQSRGKAPVSMFAPMSTNGASTSELHPRSCSSSPTANCLGLVAIRDRDAVAEGNIPNTSSDSFPSTEPLSQAGSASMASPKLSLEGSHSGLPLRPALKLVIPISQNAQSPVEVGSCDWLGLWTSTITKLPVSYSANFSQLGYSIPRSPSGLSPLTPINILKTPDWGYWDNTP